MPRTKGADVTPQLSVIVPFYNVEPYFPALLDSLAEQGVDDAEFILVDDGSTDSSPLIAKSRAAQDERFTVVTQSNLGLSAARNAGVERASGRYLAFADSDDVVPPAAYRSLIGSLEATGSDFASGDVRRLDSSGTRHHPRYADVFAASRQRTHITRDRSLILDRMVWNKVFRRSFWDRHGFAFSLAQYEDAPVTVRAHIVADAVDVLGEVVYHWRIRETGERSITQRLYEPGNLAARMRMMACTAQIIREQAPELMDVYERDMCLGDVRIALLAMKVNEPQALSEALGICRDFVTRVGPAVLDGLPEPERSWVALLREGNVERLSEVLRAHD
jgi:glycosyltransferase involved in cell wall biosynthesis